MLRDFCVIFYQFICVSYAHVYCNEHAEKANRLKHITNFITLKVTLVYNYTKGPPLVKQIHACIT